MTSGGTLYVDVQPLVTGFAPKLNSLLKGTAAIAIAKGIKDFAVSSFHEFEAAQQIAAQTGAVLKSTGGAAGVTAIQVEDLANSLRDMTGIDDDAIQASENLLLTFRDIQNVAGEGNDIFNQTEQAILDMATAMNQGAIPSQEQLKSTTIQLGKALNNPIQGMSALRRVGVSFTESQVETITKLQESGNLLEAQKQILSEVALEFGGAAEAAGDTFAGKIDKAKSKLNDFKEDVGAFLGSELLLLTGDLKGAASMWVTVADATDEANDALYNIALTAGLDGSKIGELTVAESAARTEMQHTTTSSGAHAGALNAAARAHQAEAAAAKEQNAAEHALAGGLLGIEGNILGAKDAEQSLAEARRAVTDLTNKGKRGTQEYRDAVASLRDAQLGALNSQQSLGESVRQFIQDSGRSRESVAGAMQKVKEYGRAAGLTRGEIKSLTGQIVDYITNVTNIPKSWFTKIVADTSSANATIQAFVSRWNGTHIGVTMDVTTALHGRLPGQKAQGGPVSPGQPYIVGERRPELFVPNVSGRIIPRVPHAWGGGGGGLVMISGTLDIPGFGEGRIRGLAREETREEMAYRGVR